MADTSASVLVEAKALAKSYGSTQAVKGITFSVKRGEVVGFLGPNGAGKSTTMKMLTGYLKPTQGSAHIAGVDVSQDPMAARRALGYLPENAPLYDDMMVIDFLRFISDLRGVKQAQNRLKNICERCGLMDVLGKDIGQLSKGYRQRVGLAQALVHDPDLLILDEPTSGLDPNQIIEIRSLIKDLGRDKTVLLSTHILPEVQATCGRILIINEGSLVADDNPDALTEKNAGAVIKIVVKHAPGSTWDSDRLRTLFSTVPGIKAVQAHDSEGAGTLGFSLSASGSEDAREAVFGTAVSNNLVLLDMHRERVSLEDTFRRLTRGEGGDAHA
jgi:ABC-2 type transport system ATP-binding protein